LAGGQRGAAYIIFGASSFGAEFSLLSLNGNNGFKVNGISGSDWLGSLGTSAGDVNNDGYDDIMIGGKYANPNGISWAG
jgi:FG-GAP repeat